MFDTMFKVFEKGEPKHEDIEKISSFVFCQWLGNNPKTIFAANTLNRYYNMPILNQYFYINSEFKGQKVYIKFPKKTKDSSADLDLLCKHFKLNVERAKEYLEVIDKNELEELRLLYKPKEK